MEAQPKPAHFELVYKTALAYTFFSLIAQAVTLDILLITRGLLKPSLNPIVLAALMPHPGLGLLADLAIGALLGLVLYQLRERVFNQKNGILAGFAVLALVSLVITVGPAVGMHLALGGVLRTYAVYLVRDLLTVLLVAYWVRPPRKRWLDWMVYGIIALASLLVLAWAAEAIIMFAFFGPK